MPEELTACLLCGRRELRRDAFAAWQLGLSGCHGVTQCKKCGFRFLNPRPNRAEYEQMYADGSGPLAAAYPPANGFYAQEDALRLREHLVKLRLLAQAGAGPRLLEIGACTGVFLHEAKRHGFEVEGIEPSEKNRRAARDRYGLRLRGGSVEDHDFKPESFDVVFGSHVFEHLLDPLAVAGVIHRWLRPGGVLLIEVPNQFDSFSARRKRWLHRVRPRSPSFLSVHHPVFFSCKTLRELANRSGFGRHRLRNVYYSSGRLWLHPFRATGRVLATVSGGAGLIELAAEKV